MIPIKNGVNAFAPANAGALRRDNYSERISSKPAAYHECDLSRNATNGLGKFKNEMLSPNAKAHSRNQAEPTGNYGAQPRKPNGRFHSDY